MSEAGLRAPVRTRGATWWLVACLGLSLASPPAAASSGVSLRGFAGVGYLLDTLQTRSGWASMSLLDFAVGGSVSGGFIRPQLLRWGANVAYNGTRQLVHQGASTALNGLTFGARVSLLSGSPSPVSLYASRTYVDVEQTTPKRSAGTSIITGFGGSASLGVVGYPRLTTRLGRTMIETTRADGFRSFSGLTSFGFGLAQEVKLLDYMGFYETTWSNGTFSDLQYGSHNVSLRAATALASSVQFVVNNHYYARLPTNDAPTNPRYETNSLSATLNWRQSPRLTANAGYANLQSSILARGALDVTSTSHSLNEGLQWEWRKGLLVTQQLSAQFAEARVGTQTFEGKRQDVGAGLGWHRPTSWGGTFAGVAASAGLAEPNTGGVVPIWGANLDGQLSVNRGRFSASGLYSLVYSDGGIAVFGRSFRQILRLETIYQPAPRWRFRAFLSGYGARRDDGVVGTALRRDYQVVAEAGYQQHQLQLFGSYSDGLAESLGNPVIADGLFLPAPYNSQHTDLGASIATSLDRGRLVLRATGRTTENTIRGRAPEREFALTFAATYVIGKFNLSAEDRLVVGSPSAVWYRTNTLMLRITRDFDWNF